MAFIALDSKFPVLIKYLQDFHRRNKLNLKFIEVMDESAGLGLATKGEAMAFLAHKEKIPLEEMAAIGDS